MKAYEIVSLVYNRPDNMGAPREEALRNSSSAGMGVLPVPNRALRARQSYVKKGLMAAWMDVDYDGYADEAVVRASR